MPDKRTHRGPHPQDPALFDEPAVTRLIRAVSELSWLLSHGYADRSALQLVGDRHSLNKRQRTAAMRCSCSDSARDDRKAREVQPTEVQDRALWLDGYNVLTTVEAAFAGGVLLVGRDGCLRDMASMHGSYRKVDETPPAIEAIGQALQTAGCRQAIWYLDQPVSNSGRLKRNILERGEQFGWHFDVRLVPDPDRVLTAAPDQVIATADSAVLDRCESWFNLASRVVAAHVPDPWLVDLGNSRVDLLPQ